MWLTLSLARSRTSLCFSGLPRLSCVPWSVTSLPLCMCMPWAVRAFRTPTLGTRGGGAIALGNQERVRNDRRVTMATTPLSPASLLLNQKGARGLSTNAKVGESTDSTETVARSVAGPPPFSVRVALVGSAVGLATPVFVVTGLAMSWYRFLPTQWWGRLLKLASGMLLGGGVFTFIYKFAGPFLLNHADMVLPFALANALTSAFWYAVLERRLGLAGMAGVLTADSLPALRWLMGPLLQRGLVAKIPVGGLAVGALTALTACFLWPPLVHLCWSAELQELYLGPTKESTFLIDLYVFAIPLVGLPAGLASGLALHTVLAPVLLRGGASQVKGVGALGTAVPVLTAILTVSAAYFGLCRADVSDFLWETRVHAKTGKIYSVNTRTGEEKDGVDAASTAGVLRGGAGIATFLRRPAGMIWDTFNGQESRALVPAHPTPLDGAPQWYGPVGMPVGIIRAAQVEQHERFRMTIDLLVRLKYLLLMEQEERTDVAVARGEAQKRILLEYALSRYDLHLLPLLEDMQSSIACTQLLEEGGSLDAAEKLTVRKMQEASALFAVEHGCETERGRVAVDTLLLNLPHLAHRLDTALGFKVPNDQYYKHVVAKDRQKGRDRVMKQVRSVGTALLWSGVAIAGCYMFASSRR